MEYTKIYKGINEAWCFEGLVVANVDEILRNAFHRARWMKLTAAIAEEIEYR
jgi:hypothetical protein